MEKIIKKFLEKNEQLVVKAKELKEKYNDNIRICVGSHGTAKEFFYYDPVTKKIKEGTDFIGGNNYTYYYQEIGDIEVEVTRDEYGNKRFISIARVIHPINENLEYSNDYEERKYREMNLEDYPQIVDLCNKPIGARISECINCGSQHICTQEDVENGLYTPINSDESGLICSKCVDSNLTVEEFLNMFDCQEERYKAYLIDHIGLDKDENMFA